MERLLYLFMRNPESTKTTILLSAWLLSTGITTLDCGHPSSPILTAV